MKSILDAPERKDSSPLVVEVWIRAYSGFELYRLDRLTRRAAKTYTEPPERYSIKMFLYDAQKQEHYKFAKPLNIRAACEVLSTVADERNVEIRAAPAGD